MLIFQEINFDYSTIDMVNKKFKVKKVVLKEKEIDHKTSGYKISLRKAR